MLASVYYKLSLFNAQTVILIVRIFRNVNQLCWNQTATTTTTTTTTTTATATTTTTTTTATTTTMNLF